ncbi:MAG: hypothetical protein JST82_02165 [Bacteroidetes bacterium]|nr:hypothetical protein [Bacteroidota bacterium]
MKCLILIVGIGCCMTSCGNSSVVITGSEKQKIITEVTSTLDSYANDIRKYGLLSEFKYLDSSDTFFWVPPGFKVALCYDTVRAVITRNAGMFKKIDNQWDTLRIIPLSKSIATYTGRMRSVMTDVHDSTNTYTMLETGIMIKRSNGWKLLHGQTGMLPQ